MMKSSLSHFSTIYKLATVACYKLQYRSSSSSFTQINNHNNNIMGEKFRLKPTTCHHPYPLHILHARKLIPFVIHFYSDNVAKPQIQVWLALALLYYTLAGHHWCQNHWSLNCKFLWSFLVSEYVHCRQNMHAFFKQTIWTSSCSKHHWFMCKENSISFFVRFSRCNDLISLCSVNVSQLVSNFSYNYSPNEWTS